MECVGCNEQDVVGFYCVMFGGYGGFFDQWQQVVLDIFVIDIVVVSVRVGCDFVDFVEEDDVFIFGQFDGFVGDLGVINQFVCFFVDQWFIGVFDFYLYGFGLLFEIFFEDVIEIEYVGVIIVWYVGNIQYLYG